MIVYQFNPLTGKLDAVLENFGFDGICPTSVAIGDLVYVTGPLSGDLLQVAKVDITQLAKMPALGIVVEKASTTECTFVSCGPVQMSGLIPNARYYAGLDGRPTSTPPTAALAGRPIFFQVIGVALEAGTMFFQPSYDLVKLIG